MEERRIFRLEKTPDPLFMLTSVTVFHDEPVLVPYQRLSLAR